MKLDTDALDRIAERCLEAASVLFVTGAGVSAESGLPTYRGVGGLYDSGETEEGLPIEELLSGQMMETNPAVCWKYIHQIERACRGAAPNRAHEIIAAFDAKIPRTWVLTQNVDGFHTRAGSARVIEIHGNVGRLACTECSYRTRVESYAGLGDVPSCPRCGSVVRPEVVLFGEMLPDAAIRLLERELSAGFDVVFSIGTTSVFPYISAPVVMGRRGGALTVEINPEPTEVSWAVHHPLRAKAGEALSAIWERIERG
ncbi:MAG: NAD-dependent deacylase [Polyangiaceae bacterium]